MSRVVMVLALLLGLAANASAKPPVKLKVGDAAPQFALNDLQGRPFDLKAHRGKVVILDRSDDEKAAIFDNLPAEDFKEILKAIETHEAAMDAKRSDEKKMIQSGEAASSPTLPSVEPSDGDTTGSKNLTLISIAS